MALKYIFPDPRKADAEGLVAAGGDLSTDALLIAYSQGIFPWFDKDSPILWWSPDPRMVLFPDKLRVSESLQRKILNRTFTVRIDNNFSEVIKNCATVRRKEQRGTWITDEMIQAYIDLHKAGYSHSFESYQNGVLAGGLYGISLGKAFFGESMFYKAADASKVSLYYLVKLALQLGFTFIDAQQSTPHLRSLGAEEISRDEFLDMLRIALLNPTLRGSWAGYEGELF